MSITLNCPKCKEPVSIAQPLVTDKVRCPACSAVFTYSAITSNAPARPPTTSPKKVSRIASPRRKSHWGLVVGLICAGVVALGILVVGVGIGGWLLLRPHDETGRESTLADPTVSDVPPNQALMADRASSSASTLTGDQIYRRILRSTVWIIIADESSRGFGSGVLVHPEMRLVITNFHVVGNHSNALVFFPCHEGKELITSPAYYLDRVKELVMPGRVVARDSRSDLALIRLDSLPDGVPAIRLSPKSSSPGDSVHSIGASGVKLDTLEGTLWRYTTGQVRQVYQKKQEFADGQNINAWIVETQAPTNPGDSGGPVVNGRGELVALVSYMTRIDRLVSSNIDIREVRALLENYCHSIGKTWHEPQLLDVASPDDLLVLMKKLESPDVLTRAKAAQALGSLGSEAQIAVPLLLKAWDDTDPVVQQHVAAALDKIGPPAVGDLVCLSASLNNPRVEIRKYAAGMLSKMGAASREALPVLLGAARDSNVEARRYVILTLARLGPQAKADVIPVLVKALKDEDSQIRIHAVQGLGQIGPEAKQQAFSALLETLPDADPSVRQAAFLALIDLGRPFAEDDLPLLARSLKSPVPLVRQFAAMALVDLGQQAVPVVPDLKDLLHDPNMFVRREATRTLGRMGRHAQAAIPSLFAALQDKDNEVRLISVWAIGQIGREKGVVAALLTALNDPDVNVHSAAESELRRLLPYTKEETDDLLGGLQQEQVNVRLFVLEELEKMPSEARTALPTLQRLLKDGNVLVRFRAASVLAAIGPEAKPSVATLAEVLLEKIAVQPNAFDTAVPARKASADQMTQRLLNSSVLVVWQDRYLSGIGTGSLVHLERRLVVTSYHLVSGRKQVVFFFPEQGSTELITRPDHYLRNVKRLGLSGEVVATSPRSDLALVRLSKLPLEARALSVAKKSAAPGETVYSIGSSGGDMRIGNGELWRTKSAKVQQVDKMTLRTDGEISPGDSGGPVINEKYELVGMVAIGSAVPRTFAGPATVCVDVQEVRGLLDSYFKSAGVPWPEDQSAEMVLNVTQSRFRKAVAQALEKIGPGSEAAVPALKKALEDPDPEVRKQIAVTLGAIGPGAKAAVMELLERAQDIESPMVEEAIVKIGKDAIPVLVQALKDPEVRIRLAAIRSLGRMGSVAKPVRNAILSRVRDRNPEVRKACTEALRRIDSSE